MSENEEWLPHNRIKSFLDLERNEEELAFCTACVLIELHIDNVDFTIDGAGKFRAHLSEVANLSGPDIHTFEQYVEQYQEKRGGL
jgi:hypothetical protein